MTIFSINQNNNNNICNFVIVAQVSLTCWSVSLFLDVLTLKLKIIIILPTDQPKIISWLPIQQKIKFSSASDNHEDCEDL